jgi:glutaconate CoA-transferase subunit A
MPALKLDAAILHVNVADRLGNTLVTGPDPYFDHLFARPPTPATCPPSGSRNA